MSDLVTLLRYQAGCYDTSTHGTEVNLMQGAADRIERLEQRLVHVGRSGQIAALTTENERLKEGMDTFAKLVNEMRESECATYGNDKRNEGWASARSFYANEIEAIFEQSRLNK